MVDWPQFDESAPIDCPGCRLPVDIIVRSSDNVRFAAHADNLERYSEAFPFASMTSPVSGIQTIQVEESSEVIRLMLQYMHLAPQPDIEKLDLFLLEALANAVEKYLIFSAMMVCKLCMKEKASVYPMEVLRYADKYRYREIADIAALHTLSSKLEIPEIKHFFGPHSQVFYAWSAYKDQWLSALPTIYTKPIPVPTFHKGGFADCELWAPFLDGVRNDVGCSVSGVMIFGSIVETRIKVHLDSCDRCSDRARRWSVCVKSIVGDISQFSSFM